MLSEHENKIINSIERISESVVSVISNKTTNRFPFGAMPARGAGSGVIIDPLGYIVTNYHVIDGADGVEVVMKDGKTYRGRVLGGDRATDLSLIKIEGTEFQAAKLGDSENLKVGQSAIAIGNSLDMPGGPTASTGVISALGRPLPWADFIFEGLIQTDAAINPGNSGGPLADSDGNVIGMNTAIVPFAQGIGFAIPVNTIKIVAKQILDKGRVIRPVLGISVTNVNEILARRFNLPVHEGVIITEVLEGSPAHEYGLQPGDILESIETYKLGGTKDLLFALSKLPINTEAKLRYIRFNRQREVKIRLVEGPINN